MGLWGDMMNPGRARLLDLHSRVDREVRPGEKFATISYEYIPALRAKPEQRTYERGIPDLPNGVSKIQSIEVSEGEEILPGELMAVVQTKSLKPILPREKHKDKFNWPKSPWGWPDE